jgi:tRNA-dihydrouridine synthase
VAEIADALTIPVFGSGDCIEPQQVLDRMRMGVEGVLVGRGVLRNPWILSQAADLAAGCPLRIVGLAERGQFLLEYIDLLREERLQEPEGFRHRPGPNSEPELPRHDKWVINKVRALGSWYTKGVENGSHLRTAINSAESIAALRDILSSFFDAAAPATSIFTC